ncbi:MAG TPA: hypothetical protein PLV45_12200 [bacterium]|nr:hypothetical protein [bacterium]
MPFSVMRDDELEAVVVELTGKLSLQLVHDAAVVVARICRETGYRRIMNDSSNADPGGLSIVDIYNSPETLEKSGISRTTRRALVVSKDFPDARFLENVTCNRGHNLRVFFTIDDARAWLAEKGPATPPAGNSD